MSEVRSVSYDDPAAAPLIAGLEREYRELYGAAVAEEMRRYDAVEFAPRRIGLYRTAGYVAIAPYGLYRDDPRVRCFEKALAAA